MALKPCKRCGTLKPLFEFYKHKGMTDGFLNFCKECKREESLNHRSNNLEKVKAYDRERGNRQPVNYRQTQSYKKSHLKANEKWRRNNREKQKAHALVANAINKGLLEKGPCEECGFLIVEGHHDDYSKPLEVRWLCVKHHNEHHKLLVLEIEQITYSH